MSYNIENFDQVNDALNKLDIRVENNLQNSISMQADIQRLNHYVEKIDIDSLNNQFLAENIPIFQKQHADLERVLYMHRTEYPIVLEQVNSLKNRVEEFDSEKMKSKLDFVAAIDINKLQKHITNLETHAAQTFTLLANNFDEFSKANIEPITNKVAEITLQKKLIEELDVTIYKPDLVVYPDCISFAEFIEQKVINNDVIIQSKGTTIRDYIFTSKTKKYFPEDHDDKFYSSCGNAIIACMKNHKTYSSFLAKLKTSYEKHKDNFYEKQNYEKGRQI